MLPLQQVCTLAVLQISSPPGIPAILCSFNDPLKKSFTMASNGDKMEVETAELKLKEMAHSEQHYFNRYVKCCTRLSSHALPKYFAQWT